MLLPPSEQALSELLARKEEEWRALQAHRAQLQEAALQDAQRRLEEAEGRLRRLQEDFLYNLQLLEERDRELEHYDTAFAQAQRLQEARQAEASELKIEAAKLRQALATEAQRREDLQQQHQLKLQEHRLALERVHRWAHLSLPTRWPFQWLPGLCCGCWAHGPDRHRAGHPDPTPTHRVQPLLEQAVPRSLLARSADADLRPFPILVKRTLWP